MPNTPEQQAVIDAAVANPASNIVVKALAGSGKTSTILQIPALLQGEICITAFNKSIATEIQSRLPVELQLTTTVGTAHALGLGAYRQKLARGTNLKSGNTWKLSDILKSLGAERYFGPTGKGKATLCKLVDAAKGAGFGLTSTHFDFPPIDDRGAWGLLADHFGYMDELADAGLTPDVVINLAIQMLQASNRQTLNIDFTDMIYLPLLMNLPLPQYAHVIVDEAQDLSLIRAEQALRSSSSGRLIIVGDENQAIYGFTGASADSMKLIAGAAARRNPTITLPLSVCFRCDPAIIRAAQTIVPEIQHRFTLTPGEPIPEGRFGAVDNVSIDEISRAVAEGDSHFYSPDGDKYPVPQLGDVFLCRLNRPNVAMCLTLLAAGLPARIEGRDLSEKLLLHCYSAVKQTKATGAAIPLSYVAQNISDYADGISRKLLSEEKIKAEAYFQDEVGCARILLRRAMAEGIHDMRGMETFISSIFGDNIPPASTITLASVHKSKGREWRRVFLLGKSDYMPFFMAKAEWEKEQEQNLIYVAITRAERTLIVVDDVRSWVEGDACRIAMADVENIDE